MHAVIGALDDDPAVGLAEPFDIHDVGEVLGRLFAAFAHEISFGHGNVVNAAFARGGDIADGAGLDGDEGFAIGDGLGLTGILKGEEAAGEVGAGVAGEVESDGFGATVEPDPALDAAALAVVNFAADDVVVDAPSHVSIKRGYKVDAICELSTD